MKKLIDTMKNFGFSNEVIAGVLGNIKVECNFELKAENISCKIKVGQNLNEEKRNRLMEKLKNRDLEIDKETIKLINH